MRVPGAWGRGLGARVEGVLCFRGCRPAPDYRCWDHVPRPRARVFSCLLYSPPCADKKCRVRLGLTDP